MPLNAENQMVLASTCFALMSYQIFRWMNESSPLPYMDEEFHIPQAAAFCAGNLTQWDPKITTLPGLYYLSILLLKPASVLGFPVECSAWNLRLTNLIIGITNLFLFRKLLLLIHRREPDFTSSKALFSAVNLSTFPLLYFFSFLFYTDQASTALVLTTILFHLKKQRRISFMFAAMSVLARQTNIVWVGCLALLEVWACYKIIMRNVLKKNDLERVSKDEDIQLLAAPFLSFIQLPTKANIRRIFGYFIGVILESLPRIFGYSLVIIAFGIFLIINKGIVVGDRNAHQPVFHIPQLFYFAAFATFFASPFLISPTKIRKFLGDIRRKPVVFLFILGAILISIHQFTYVHPYLIADNRHYPFYIWKRIIAREWWTKYLLSPVYLFSLWTMMDELKHLGFFHTVLIFVAIFSTLVPQKLLEFRYFIIPFLLFRMQIRNPSWTKLAAEFILYQVVNFLTIYLFVKRGFVSDNRQVAHFMW